MIWAQLLVRAWFSFLMVLVYMQGSKGCVEKERSGLLDIKAFFDSNGGHLPSSWVEDRDANCCDWERVHCNNASGHVTDLILDGVLGDDESLNVTMNFSLLHPFEQLLHLDLSDNYFAEAVDIEGICGLKNLQELDISHNIINVSLPECMANLTSLKVLDLSSTSMTGNVPPFITSLKSLEYFSLFDTRVNGFFSFNLLANHSKLEVFRLSSTAKDLHVETESPPWFPSFQLKALQLGDCNLSVIPSFLWYQHELTLLDLSRNKLQGDFPTWLLNNNSKLETLRLTSNSFAGTLQLPTSKHGLLNLGISSNKFGGQLPENLGKIFPNLTYLNLAGNDFEGSLPSSMLEMQRVQTLDLSNNNFSGELGTHFFSNWTSLISLSLSYNNFSGYVIPKFANSASLKFLLLRNNHFFGEIDGALNRSSLVVLDISNNVISGRIPTWIGNFESLQSFSISGNLLEGAVPDTICNLKSIIYLDFSENSLSGSLPYCLESLKSLRFLHMRKNALNDSIPHGLPASLHSLDLRDNEFSGGVPYLGYGKPFHDLSVLLLGGNQLSGAIPDFLCYIETMRIMDLSRNKFSGVIPSCLASIRFAIDPCQTITDTDPCIGSTRWAESIRVLPEMIVPGYNSTLILNYNSLDDYYVIKQPIYTVSYSSLILQVLSGLDLSINELSGSIPPAIGQIMGDLRALNLSHNHLSGNIPSSFAKLLKVESLDLSCNNLSGAIPSDLTALGFLVIFNVSYNNLSGPVPTTRQFATFDIGSYRGNPGLSGSFLNRSSSGIMSPSPSSP